MKKDRTDSSRQAELCKRAQARLERDAKNIPDLSPVEVRKLVHELRTHQIELELQNEELRRAQVELLESRDRYSDLYDFAPVGYLTASPKGMILEANLTLAEMLRVERRALLNQPVSNFIARDDQDIYYRHHQAVHESKRRSTCQLRMLRRNAEPLWADMDSILMASNDCHHRRMRTVVSDITERKQAEEDRRTLERRLLHAQKLESLGVLAGGIAHDFNNLLTVILGNADLALYALPPMSPARGNLEEIEKASKRAAELANQMLAYSGKSRFVVEPIDIGELVGEIAHLLDVSISKKAVLEYNFTDNLPTFNGDVTQIRQVIMNLITNAAEAIGDQGGVITMSSGAVECDRQYLDRVSEVLGAPLDEPLPEGVYTYLEVTDTGSGMDRETMVKIFDPFFSTKFAGRGLGMSTVLGIMRGLRGALEFHSEVGKGTMFKVLFPANESPEQELMTPRKHECKGRERRTKGTVLIVDDEESICAVTEQMLHHMGFTVLRAPDGRGALEMLRDHPDEIICVLLDLTMPHMDGLEAFSEIQRLHPRVKIILCSGYNEQDATERFAGKGLAGFIQKPYDMTALSEELRSVLCDD